MINEKMRMRMVMMKYNVWPGKGDGEGGIGGRKKRGEGKDEGERLQLSAKWVRFWAARSDGMGFQARTIENHG